MRFELQALERRLLVDGQPAALGACAFDLLLELAAHPGTLRSKNGLIHAVWPGVIVEDGSAFYHPTLLEVTDNTLPIVREEAFSPVQTLQGFDAEEEAIGMANDSG